MSGVGELVVSLSVVTGDDTKAARAAEVMARAATGLALDDIPASFHIGRVDEEDS